MNDLRYALRMMARNPGFTMVALLTLALGIGANTAIFSVVNAVLLRPFGYQDPDQLMILSIDNHGRGITDVGVSMPDFRDWRARNQVFDQMAAYSLNNYNLVGDSEPERVRGAIASPNIFALLGVAPARGRGFLAEEGEWGRHRAVVLSHGLWQRRYGSDQSIVGRSIRIDGQDHVVVGVMPPGFSFPEPRVALWVPLALEPGSEYDTRGNYWLRIVARLKPGVTAAQAKAEMARVSQQMEREIEAAVGMTARVETLSDSRVGDVRRGLLVLLAAVCCVLLVACANVANLLLARGASRAREIAVRAALGAGRGRIIRQLLAESALLGIAGGASGLLLALWGVELLSRFGPRELPRLGEVNIDGRVLGFALLTSLATSLVFGLAPALQISRADLTEMLKEGGRTVGSSGSRRLRQLLIITEVALALVLLAAAGLMINSFVRLQRVDPGFRIDHLLTVSISLPESKYPNSESARIHGFYQQLIEQVRALPGVEAASAATSIPLGGDWGKLFTIADRPEPSTIDAVPAVRYQQMTAGHIEAMGIRVVRGRAFTASDRRDSLKVAMVNESLARRHFPNEDPIGRQIYLGPPERLVPPGILPPGFHFPRLTIVGVTADTKQDGLNRPAPIEVYTLHEQAGLDLSRSLNLLVRTKGEPKEMVAAVRQQVLSLDREQPIADIRTMEEVYAESLAQTRFATLLLGIFSALALLLAAIGVYGVISYSVAQRSRELGIRLALGAASRDLLHLVIGEGLRLAAAGVALGLLGAFALTRLMTGLLYGIAPSDPLTFITVAALLLAVALLACWVPARRAARIDPIVALRDE